MQKVFRRLMLFVFSSYDSLAIVKWMVDFSKIFTNIEEKTHFGNYYRVKKELKIAMFQQMFAHKRLWRLWPQLNIIGQEHFCPCNCLVVVQILAYRRIGTRKDL